MHSSPARRRPWLPRPFTFALFVASVTLVAPTGAEESDQIRSLAILQVNDVYKIEGIEAGRFGGLARLRTLRTRLEDEGKAVLLLHAGDFLYPSVMSKYMAARPMVRVMNLLDGDPIAFDPHLIVTLGNHELDNPDPGILLGRIAESDFVWVSSNVRYRTTAQAPGEVLGNRLANVHEQYVTLIGGVRVGIIGLTLADRAQDYVSYIYGDRQERRRIIEHSLAAVMAAGAELVVAITHQDMVEDRALAREFPRIDVICGGHEHFFQAEQVGTTWITKADADIRTAIVIDVTIDAKGARHVTPRKLEVDSEVPGDSAVAAEVTLWCERLPDVITKATGRKVTEVHATTEHMLEGIEPVVRGGESALGNFLADVLRDRMVTDLAFVNGGAIRINDNIPAGGVITGLDLEGIIYFDDKIVACELTGAQILAMLEHCVAGMASGSGGFLQVSGVRYAYGPASDPPAPRVAAADVEVFKRALGRLAPLDLTFTYTVAMPDYLYEQGYRDGYEALGTDGTSPRRVANPKGELELDWRQITVEAMAALADRRITTAKEGRIRPRP